MSDSKTYNEERDSDMDQTRILTVKEVSERYKISKSSLYELIDKRAKTLFPVWNIGTRKKFVIPEKELIQWLGQRNIITSEVIPTGEDLLKRFRK
ncbi:MAG: helix-turn-helix domain-containing protein [Bdellovibrionota bacterium]|nr:helix-turn-helix domain-containing protein [Bdellovibrionota bacterium]